MFRSVIPSRSIPIGLLKTCTRVPMPRQPIQSLVPISQVRSFCFPSNQQQLLQNHYQYIIKDQKTQIDSLNERLAKQKEWSLELQARVDKLERERWERNDTELETKSEHWISDMVITIMLCLLLGFIVYCHSAKK